MRVTQSSSVVSWASAARTGLTLSVLLAACGGSQTTEVAIVTPPETPVVETVPVEVEPELTAEQIAAQQAAAAEAAWESAGTLVRESVPGNRPYAEIVGLLESYIERNPTVAEAWFNLGLMREEQGDVSGAREAYERAGQVNPGYARGLANLSWLQLQEGDVMGALDTIRTCLSIKENEPGCNINLSLMYRRGDTSPEASDGSDPNSAAIRRIRYGLLDSIDAEAYTVMAEIYQEQGQLDLARLVCENAVAQNLTSSRLWNRLGLIALAQDDPLRAYASFRESVAMDPSNLDAQLNVASMAFSFRDYPTAAAAYALVAAERDDEAILLAYGASLRGLEDYDGAVAQYETVLQRNPTSLRAMYNMAVLMQEGRQDYGQACTYYRQFLADGGAASDPQYEDTRRRFNSLSELTMVMAEMGEMDPAIAAACAP